MSHATGTLADMQTLQDIETRANGLPAPGVGITALQGPGWTLRVRDVVLVDGTALSLPDIPGPIGKPRPQPTQAQQVLLDAQAAGTLYAYPSDSLEYLLDLATEEDAMTVQYHIDNAVELVVVDAGTDISPDTEPDPAVFVTSGDKVVEI